MRAQIDNMEAGFAADHADVNLPDGVFTEGRNFRLRDGAIEKCKGTNAVFGSLSSTAIWISSITDGITQFWTYGNESVLYATDGVNHAQISTLSYNATLNLGYTGGPFRGFMVLNDANVVPQQWTPGLANKVTDLVNWPASTYCKVIRSFGAFLIALRVTQGGIYNPRLMRWSDAAPLGALPSSWDYTDPTNQAGINELGQTQDEIIDCAPLRDTNVVYKQNNTWLMYPAGLPDVFGFRQLFSQSGLLTEDCIGQVGSQHFAVTDSDIMLHDGAQGDSLIERTMRRWLFNALDQTYYRRSFVIIDTKEREVWFCFPEAGNAACNLALVWSSINRKPHVRELGELMSAGNSGIFGGALVTWDADAGTWDDNSGSWDDANFSPTAQRLILAAATRKKAVQGNYGETFDGTDMSSYVVRSNMALTKDVGVVKRIQRVWPKVYGTTGDTLLIRVGVSDAPGSAVTWSNQLPFTIGTDRKVDCRLTGRYVHLRIGYVGGMAVRIPGFDVEFDHAGLK